MNGRKTGASAWFRLRTVQVFTQCSIVIWIAIALACLIIKLAVIQAIQFGAISLICTFTFHFQIQFFSISFS
jgi:hypothetical protein